MRIDMYWLTAQTNMHVGSGDANYGVIDNLVQRDVLTELPTIHESSLKGALREYCTHLIKVAKPTLDTNAAHKEEEIKQNFGNSDDAAGSLRFYGANLLTFPVRTNKTMFLHATCPALLHDFQEKLALFGYEKLANVIAKFIENINDLEANKPFVFDKSFKDHQIEYKDKKGTLKELKKGESVPEILGNQIVLLHDEDAKLIVGKNKLPVIARNSLRDGQSENLWYEEIVPRQTKFYFFVQDNAIGDTSQYQWFEAAVNDKSVQVGANASIGQGLCKIQKYSKSDENNAE